MINWIQGVPPLDELKEKELILVVGVWEGAASAPFVAEYAEGALHDTYDREPFSESSIVKWARIKDEPESETELPDELKRTFSNLMYAFTKEAARISFVDFLEEWEINDSDYEDIRKYLKDKYGVKTYV